MNLFFLPSVFPTKVEALMQAGTGSVLTTIEYLATNLAPVTQ